MIKSVFVKFQKSEIHFIPSQTTQYNSLVVSRQNVPITSTDSETALS